MHRPMSQFYSTSTSGLTPTSTPTPKAKLAVSMNNAAIGGLLTGCCFLYIVIMQPMKSEPEIVNKGNCIKEVAEHKGEKPKKVKSTGIFSTRTWRPDGAKNQIDYVERFHQVAQEEQKQFGIPASITLAQAIVESNNGESNLCKATNNHFGIKCFSTKCAKGHCKNFKDDSHKDFFRCYSSAWMSFREHSKFLSAHKYKKYNGLSAKEWCNGLKENGYATDSDYADRLYSIIVQLDLEFYDL